MVRTFHLESWANFGKLNFLSACFDEDVMSKANEVTLVDETHHPCRFLFWHREQVFEDILYTRA